MEHAAHAGLDQNVAPQRRNEGGQHDAHGIGIGRQAGELEPSVIVGDGLAEAGGRDGCRGARWRPSAARPSCC